MAREDIENQLRPINHARIEHALDIALLRRRKVVIKQNDVCRNRGCRARNLLQFSFANQGGWIGAILALREFANNLRARARGERPQFVERLFRTKIGRIFR